MSEPMTIEQALKIVLELAEQNVLTDRQAWTDDLQDEQARQISAVAIVRIAFRVT